MHVLLSTYVADSDGDLATSALPGAPVIADPARGRTLRCFAAARLRTFARSTNGLADRVDACYPRTALSQPGA